jgi:hypothetical protein
MNNITKRLVEGYDVEYNRLSKTLKMTLLLDEEAIRLVCQTSATPTATPEDVADQALELLERSIHLNLPRKMQQGPHGPAWNIPDVG